MLKKILSSAVVAFAIGLLVVPSSKAEKLVLLITNDTHSQIDPTDDDDLGGILRRKVVVDSVRSANPNVMLIDMGDVVQGTLYFNLYGGEVENRMMNELGYDIRILGNHEFDNGVSELAKNWKGQNSVNITTNYKITDPELAPLFRPYLIKEFGDKKIGFIGINLNPKGMISEGNYDGIEYLDAMKAANATAWHLKHNEGVDMVMALTHIGYLPSGTGTSDTELAAATEDIDIILGGHSHTLINPASANSEPWILPTADGDSIPVTQAGKSGKYVGLVEIDLDTKATDYSLIRIDSRLDDRIDPALEAVLVPYRQGVDEIMKRPVAKASRPLDKESEGLLNYVADFIRDRGRQLDPALDFAIVNKGGIRRSLPKGTVTEGQIQSMLPFNNRIVVLEISGKDILENFGIMTETDGNGVSSEVEVAYEPRSGEILSARLNGKDIDPAATYRVATIDYLANGGDYMTPLTRAVRTAESPNVVYVDLLEFIKNGKYKGKTINPSDKKRMRSSTH